MSLSKGLLMLALVAGLSHLALTVESDKLPLDKLTNFYLSQLRYENRKENQVDRCFNYWLSLNDRLERPFGNPSQLHTMQPAEVSLFYTVLQHLKSRGLQSQLTGDLEECIQLLPKTDSSMLPPMIRRQDSAELEQLRQRVAAAAKEPVELEQVRSRLAEVEKDLVELRSKVSQAEQLKQELLSIEANCAPASQLKDELERVKNMISKAEWELPQDRETSLKKKFDYEHALSFLQKAELILAQCEADKVRARDEMLNCQRLLSQG